jgi:ketosteroid isomerase-like protein
MRRPIFLMSAAFLIGAAPQSTPQSVANELFSADRAFSDAGATGDVIAAISAMFADDVMAPARPGEIVKGKADLVAVMRANPSNEGVRATWAPVRAGVSADGLHGFTFGFMTLRRGDTPPTFVKYLAYWVKKPEGWRVAAYRRTPRPEGEVSRETMPPSLPATIVAATDDAGVIGRHRASLIAAEKAFSDLAQKAGLGAAFKENGRSDAVNMGGPTASDFTYGNEAIGQAIGRGSEGQPSPVFWSAETALVASSGDLGITFGLIRPNAQPGAPGSPFFTIWKRDSPTSPWRYIAE